MKSKGSILLVLFSIFVLHMGMDISFDSHSKQIVIESIEHSKSADKSFVSETGHDDDVMFHELSLSDPLPLKTQQIIPTDFNIQNQFCNPFWQPPKYSDFLL